MSQLTEVFNLTAPSKLPLNENSNSSPIDKHTPQGQTSPNGKNSSSKDQTAPQSQQEPSTQFPHVSGAPNGDKHNQTPSASLQADTIRQAFLHASTASDFLSGYSRNLGLLAHVQEIGLASVELAAA